MIEVLRKHHYTRFLDREVPNFIWAIQIGRAIFCQNFELYLNEMRSFLHGSSSAPPGIIENNCCCGFRICALAGIQFLKLAGWREASPLPRYILANLLTESTKAEESYTRAGIHTQVGFRSARRSSASTCICNETM